MDEGFTTKQFAQIKKCSEDNIRKACQKYIGGKESKILEGYKCQKLKNGYVIRPTVSAYFTSIDLESGAYGDLSRRDYNSIEFFRDFPQGQGKYLDLKIINTVNGSQIFLCNSIDLAEGDFMFTKDLLGETILYAIFKQLEFKTTHEMKGYEKLYGVDPADVLLEYLGYILWVLSKALIVVSNLNLDTLDEKLLFPCLKCLNTGAKLDPSTYMCGFVNINERHYFYNDPSSLLKKLIELNRRVSNINSEEFQLIFVDRSSIKKEIYKLSGLFVKNIKDSLLSPPSKQEQVGDEVMEKVQRLIKRLEIDEFYEFCENNDRQKTLMNSYNLFLLQMIQSKSRWFTKLEKDFLICSPLFNHLAKQLKARLDLQK